MADKIQIDYATVDKIVVKFSDKQEELNELRQRLSQHIEDLRQGGWIGESADRFYVEMDNLLLPSMQRSAQAMQAASEALKTISQEFHNAEDEAKGLVGFDFNDSPPPNQWNSPSNASNDPNKIHDGTWTGEPMATADVIFVNGIWTEPDAHLKSLEYLEEEFGEMGVYGKDANIAGIYNQTEGKGSFGDVKQAAFDRWSLPQDNPAVNSLVAAVKERLANPVGNFEIVAHSQGAAITAEAMRQLAAQGVDLSRVEITTLGGAGIDFPEGVTTHHYVHPADPIGMGSVIEDPHVRESTTVMANVENPPSNIFDRIKQVVSLDDHNGADYIENISEFRRLESQNQGQIAQGSPLDVVGDIAYAGKQYVIDEVQDFVSDVRTSIEVVDAVGDLLFW